MDMDDFCIREFISDCLNYNDDDKDYEFCFGNSLKTCGFRDGTGGNYLDRNKLLNPNIGFNSYHICNSL